MLPFPQLGERKLALNPAPLSDQVLFLLLLFCVLILSFKLLLSLSPSPPHTDLQNMPLNTYMINLTVNPVAVALLSFIQACQNQVYQRCTKDSQRAQHLTAVLHTTNTTIITATE